MFPMIVLRRLSNAQPGALIWVDEAVRGRYLLNAANGPGPIARDWDGKIDKPLTNVPEGYRHKPLSKPKPENVIEKVYKRAKGKGK